MLPNIDYALDPGYCKLAHLKVEVNTFPMSYSSLSES